MRLPYLPSLLLVVTILPVIIAEPDVFGDYFDDGMKLVDISQDAALRSCLSDGKTADKTKAAYDGCYGQGYDFDDLAKAGGDDDGLPDELEEKEGCFYKKMGWVSEDNVMDEAAIAADMEGLENEIQEGFLSDVGTCVAWSGNFGERRKREAGMEAQEDTQDTQDREVVPGLMDTGRRAMGWVQKLIRKVRSPGNKKRKNERKCKKDKKGNCLKKKRGRARSGKKGPGSRNKKAGKPMKKKGGKGRPGKLRKKKKDETKKKNGPANISPKKRRRNGSTRSKKNKGKKVKQEDGRRPSKKRSKGKDKNKGRKGGKKKPCKGKKDCPKNSRTNKNTRSGKKKNGQSLPEAVYNKLWCIDLAIEQALEKCVEAKILN